MSILACVWILLTALVALPVLVFAAEVLAALPRRAGDPPPAPAILPRTVVLVPAHDEERGIATTLRSLARGLGPRDHVLVVADNCRDATARVARDCGAQVIERRDATHRGKSHALQYGIDHLRAAPPDVVLIVDADCLVEATALRDIAARAVATQRPVQALYLMQAPAELGFGGRLAQFAWRVKNEARPLGMQRLGVPCHLTGSGMGFAWPLVAGARLASGHLVEDMQLGMELAAAGAPPLFLPEARVHSRFAVNTAGAASQRTRWEHGHLQVIASQVPRLLGRALRTGSWKLLGLALDLAVPPLALLVLLSVASLGASALFALLPGVPGGVLWIPALALLLLAVAVLLAWARFGRDIVPLRELLGIPVYVLRKVPLYLRFLTARQTGWVRSARDEPPDNDGTKRPQD